jgi:hypothetical protein
MASKLNKRYTIEPVAPEFPGRLCLWLRQQPASNEIIVRKTRSLSRKSRQVFRTCYRVGWEETMH